MPTGHSEEAHNKLVLSYLAMRQTVGYLGMFLPLSLLAYGLISSQGMKPSISEFYYTPMRDILVGTLSAIAVFLGAYQGYAPRPGERLSDRMVARAAALGALGVAMVPTSGPPGTPCSLLKCALGSGLSRWVHYGFATLFFFSLALFCLVLFTRTGGHPPSAEQRRYNRLYQICGWTLIAVIVLLGITAIVYAQLTPTQKRSLDATRLVFVLETIGVLAFSLSWLAKGRCFVPLKTLIQRWFRPHGERS